MNNDTLKTVLGEGSAFHNPYTFIPFSNQQGLDPVPPTPLTADEEADGNRFTGILRLKITTKSPLLTCNPEPEREDQKTGHKTYRAMAIGKDVIVPASGIRGSLRSLMTVLTGSSLGYLDQHLHLCQQRAHVRERPQPGPNSRMLPPERSPMVRIK